MSDVSGRYDVDIVSSGSGYQIQDEDNITVNIVTAQYDLLNLWRLQF